MSELKGLKKVMNIFISIYDTRFAVVASVINYYLGCPIIMFNLDLNILAVALKPKFSMITITDTVYSENWIPI